MEVSPGTGTQSAPAARWRPPAATLLSAVVAAGALAAAVAVVLAVADRW